MGTELARRGVSLPKGTWSADALVRAPEVVRQVHRDYVDVGADILTANTFRTHARSLRTAGWQTRAGELTRIAVELARYAAGDRAWVAGSQAPLDDCYSPELVPADTQLAEEHARHAEYLARAGVDLILIETMNTIREAVAATKAAVTTGLPVLVSFVCRDDARLLSGERIDEAAVEVSACGPQAVLVNCLPAASAGATLRIMQSAVPGVACGAYANTGIADERGHWHTTSAADPTVYAPFARDWLRAGARIVGGCCGTTPEHVRNLRSLIDAESAS
jgi:homocysteine S-methyltransferase